MKTDQKTRKKLEYDEILKLLAACAPTEGAVQMALALLPDDDEGTVARRLTRTGDACRLLSDKGMPSFGSVRDVSDAVDRAGKGATLSTHDLLDVGNILRTSRGLLDYIHVNRHFDTSLDEIFERLMPLLFEKHPVRVPILGTSESIREITPGVLYTCHRGFYNPGNMILCVIGDVSPDDVERIAGEALPKEPVPVAQKRRA